MTSPGLPPTPRSATNCSMSFAPTPGMMNWTCFDVTIYLDLPEDVRRA